MRKNRAKGDMVLVGAERIIRSVDKRKDKHSKICTSKGARDRRIRLSANTAIQFYDVQDRLGYDRPSNVIDWLMKKAKYAIDHVVDVDHYHSFQELLLPNTTTTSSIFNLSEALHRDQNTQNLTHNDQTDGFNNYVSVAQDVNFPCSTIPTHLAWNPSYKEGEAFEFVNRESLQSNFNHTPNNEFANEDDDGLLVFPFEQEIRAQQEELQGNEDDSNYDHF